MRISLGLALVMSLAACGGGKKIPDAGNPVDDSCGLDCEQQKLFGLLKNNCFEYSDTAVMESTPALGMMMSGTFTLEGNVKVLQVDYTSGGQMKMTDYFAFPNRKLTLMRREYASATASSVTYKDSMNNIVGVPWSADPSPAVGTLVDTSSETAYLVMSASSQSMEAVDYRVTAVDATSDDLTNPSGTYDGGVTLLFDETPDHGADGKRVLVPQVGFVGFSTPFALSGGSATTFRLQTIRANATTCGLGGP